ncbi:hypothetical protein QWY84_19290 [Aquisalimonas lutea]|uniref:hypothetical protein n=1 Tax=Aquisalimonas lutea TaxID=1327750 RepID=UPI0025B45813|nr:hypothetical protein [Aquisalimonas lutea]MDN3519757.1 hypothetical protein [Aquisalimonas lutea]
MTYWCCRLDEGSLERLRRDLDLPDMVNRMHFQSEWGLPLCQVRERAMDAFMVLARQTHPSMERARIRALLNELHLVCEPSSRPAP